MFRKIQTEKDENKRKNMFILRFVTSFLFLFYIFCYEVFSITNIHISFWMIDILIRIWPTKLNNCNNIIVYMIWRRSFTCVYVFFSLSLYLRRSLDTLLRFYSTHTSHTCLFNILLFIIHFKVFLFTTRLNSTFYDCYTF
jgi:hypothetical protein